MYRTRRIPLILLMLSMLALSLPATASADSGCWTCWDPGGVPDPCRNTLYDVAIVPGTGGAEAWAVGDMGTILRYQGGTWSKVPSPTTERLYAVDAARSDLALATGWEGTALKWDGSSWTPLQGYDGSGGDYLRSVAFWPGTNGAEGWAAGDGPGGIGRFYYWNGTTLSMKKGSEQFLFGGSIWDIEMLSADLGFAACEYIGDGYVWQWDGDDWTSTLIPDDDLVGIAANSATDAWAVGDEGAIYRYDGATWAESGIDGFTDDLSDVDLVDSSFGWAVGEYGALLRWTGSEWQDSYLAYSLGIYNTTLRAVTFEGAGFGWAVGEAGVILHWDGANWSNVTGADWGSITHMSVTPGSGGADIWASGWGGPDDEFLHWNGATWQGVPMPDDVHTIKGVSMVSANDGWAAGVAIGGTNKALHWNGSAWTVHSDIPRTSEVMMASTNDGWALGNGTILHWDGASWTEVDCPIDRLFYGSETVSATDMWGGASSGKMVHYDGASWQEVAHGTGYSNVVWDIGMTSGSSEGYAGGSNGKLLKWNGSSWSELDYVLDGYFTMRSVDVVSSTGGVVGWVLADDGKALRIEDGVITQETLPTGNMIFALEHVSPYEAWAAGDSGVILHWLANERPGQEPPVFLPMIRR